MSDTYKLIVTVRGGSTNSPLVSARYNTVEDARAGSKQLMHENARITRVMIVVNQEPPRFVEWIEKS